MSFMRTRSGLSNLYLFHKVDVIVFVEGGKKSFSIAKVLAGFFNKASIDIVFWQSLFQKFTPAKKIQFRAIGSKSTLQWLAKEIISGNITNVYVAMDRDHDKTNKLILKGTGIFYTFGYSWENDVWCKDVIEALFYSICRVSKSDIDIDTYINECFSEFCRGLRWFIYADIILSGHDIQLIPRTETEFNKLIPVDASNKPIVDRSFMRTLLSDARKRSKMGTVSSKNRIYFEPCCDCYGHLYRNYCYRVLNYLLTIYSTQPLPSIHADSLAIDTFTRLIDTSNLSQIKKHYQKQYLKL